jgi:hypothetical protein
MQYYRNTSHPSAAGSNLMRFVFALLYPTTRH